MILFSRFVFICYALLLAACVSTPIYQFTNPINYEQLPAYRYDIAEVLVIDDSRPTDTTIRFREAFNVTPAQALEEWADNRIIAAGTRGTFSIIVKDANITAEPLKTSGGIRGYFTTEQAEMLNAYLHVILAIEGNERGLPPAEATISVRASHSIPENATAQMRGQIYRSVINELMSAFNAEADKQMHSYFSAYTL